MNKLTEMVRAKLEEEWGRPHEPVGSLYKKGTIGYEKAKANRKSNREAWMASFEKAVVSKHKMHAGIIDWNTARHLHFSGHAPEDAAKKYVQAHIDALSESGELEEGNVPKVQGFSNFKRMAQDWAMNNTHHGKTNIKKHDAVLPNGKILRQTLSLGHANNGQSYIIGVFNHEGKDSDNGFGWHHHRDQGINEEVNEAFSDTVKKVGKKLAARPNKGAMPAAGRTKKMTEEEQLDEGKVKELSMDLDDMHDSEFVKKYGKSKEEWHGILGSKPKASKSTKSNVREPRQEFPTEEVELDEATAPKYDPAKMDEFEASREYQYHAGQAAFHRNSQGWTGKFNDIYNRDWKKEAAHHERHMKALKKVLDHHKLHNEEAIDDYPTLDEETLFEGSADSERINDLIKTHGKRHMMFTGPGEPMQHGLGVKDLKAKLGVSRSAAAHKAFVKHLDGLGFKSGWSHTSNEWVYHPK